MPLDIKTRLNRTLEGLAEGWEQLKEKASQALTRFIPPKAGEVETVEEQMARRSPGWGFLPGEVMETPEEVIVRVEIPGMDPRDFSIEVVDDLLVIQGEKRFQRERREGAYGILECAYGSFTRTFPLPAPVDDARARATYRRGVLRIALPKRRPSRRIRVRVS